MIPVNKSYLPPMEEYNTYLEKIWESAWLTNNGQMVRQLEHDLKEYLGVKHLFFTTNGTIVLQMAIKALNLSQKIITTPFSYVATTSAILWENCTPVFVDIDPQTCCIDPNKIEAAITEETEAIMATHVYGIPCDLEAIQKIAEKHGLKVIYDAAHAFGVNYKGESVLKYGDFSTVSFHATKLFHTIEGGAIITDDDDLARAIDLSRSFGHKGDDHFALGINAKNSEYHAAMGLCNLPRVPEFIRKRKALTEAYDEWLKPLPIFRPIVPDEVSYNYSYYPIFFENEKTLLKVKQNLEDNGIFARRYFYPSLNELPYVKGESCPVSEKLARTALCLPFYYDLTMEEAALVAKQLKAAMASANGNS